MRYNKIIYILLFWFAIYATIEIIMNLIYNENVPAWKTFSISLITAICTCYVLFKKNKDLTLKDLMTYQERDVVIFKDIDKEFQSRLSQRLKEKGFVMLSDSHQDEVKFKTKTSFKTFGEIYKILIFEDKITISSKPKLFTNFITENASVVEKINEIENIINQSYR